ncbi:MAG: ATP-binding cassette domain-containing protein, partial [Tissierellia bacterium]|nr:ATP-binding cassette domain-containing protein [Tissierellia bacterium]
MIQLENISKYYSNGVQALKNIDLEIEQGEFVFVVGASGAGKSTLIKLLLKEEVPTSGKIVFNEDDITKLSHRKIPKLRRKIGVVFQDFRLLPRKTVYENVAIAMEIMGKSAKEIRRQVPLVLSLVGLSERATNYPDQLSGGEHQRVAIARAIINNPQVLIADEPTG